MKGKMALVFLAVIFLLACGAGTAMGSVSLHSPGIAGNTLSPGSTTGNSGVTTILNSSPGGISPQMTYSQFPYLRIFASAGAGGSISPSGYVYVSNGSSKTFTITPATGYQVADVWVDGGSVGAVNSYIFSNVTANHTITACFAAGNPGCYTITASAETGGSISPSGAVSVAAGGSKTFTITPANGYQVYCVRVDGDCVGAVSSYTFSNVTANHTIVASFSAINPCYYTIAASAGPGGSISPSGAVSVSPGGSQAFNITATSGYQVADVRVDGSSVGAVNSYTFNNVSANHTIEASFTAITPCYYTIAASAGAGGSISPSGDVHVSAGSSQAFTITPSNGYRVSDVRVDGSSRGAISSYTFNNVTANHIIVASFAPCGGGVGSGPRINKQNLLNEMRLLRGNITDKQDRNKLDSAIEHLAKSLTSSWWVDNTHLKVTEGERVFQEEKYAADKLSELLKDKKSAIPDATMLRYITTIVNADRELASTAIGEAVDPGDIDEANKELDKGNSEVAEGKYGSAIEHYKNAWQHAVKA